MQIQDHTVGFGELLERIKAGWAEDNGASVIH
jgi:hypothetical protein